MAIITRITLIKDLLYIPEKDTAASDFERLKKFLMFLIINSMDKIFFQFLVTHVCNTLSRKSIGSRTLHIYSMEQLQNSIFALCLLPVDNDHKSGAMPVPPYIQGYVQKSFRTSEKDYSKTGTELF